MTQGYRADRWPEVLRDRPWGSWPRARVPSPEAAGAHHHGYFCQPCSHKPFPSSPQQAACPLAHKPSRQLLQFLALVHPLHPGGLITSDPRRWVNPFPCPPKTISLCPHTQKGKILESLEEGGLLSKADASVHPCMTGLPSGSKIWPQVE